MKKELKICAVVILPLPITLLAILFNSAAMLLEKLSNRIVEAIDAL